jgi:hypothetical protein
MNGGIDQLINTYKVNPNPLQERVQRAQQQAQQKMLQQGQQGQPSNEIPPDLEEALALQEIAKLHQGAQNQQAMQAGGAQPSVVEKLRQMLGNMQQQGQPQMGQMPQQPPQGQPVMAARGGSIDQLMSNLGRHYAGGGIVAFKTGDEVEDPDKKPLRYYPLSEQGADWEARRQAERDAKTKAALEEEERRQALISQIPTGGQQAPASTGRLPGEIERNVNNAMAAMPGASVVKPFSGAGIRALMGLFGVLGNSETTPPAPTSQAAAPSNETGVSDQKQSILPYGQTKVDLSNVLPPENKPKPNINNVNVTKPAAPVKPAAPAVETVDPMETIIRNSIMKTMGQDPDEVRRKAIEANTKAMGLDALLKPAQDRVAAREAMIKQIQEDRTPEWVKGLQRAGRANPRSGVGGLLGELGAGATEARESYSAENLRFLDELNKLNSEIDKAKIEGRYKDVAAGEAAVKDLISSQRQAETSGTSLLNKQAQVEATKQIALDNRLARAQSANQHNAQMALQLEEKKRQFNEELLRKMREKEVDRYNKIETAIAKRTGMIDMQLQNPKLKPEEETALLAKRNTIVEQVKAEYPPIKPEKPTESQFLAAARAANPGVSDADLKAYYKQNYGS